MRLFIEFLVEPWSMQFGSSHNCYAKDLRMLRRRQSPST